MKQVDQEKQLTIFQFEGDITFSELGSFIRSFYENPTSNILCDYRKSSPINMSSDQMEVIAKLAAPLSERRTGGKTAVVFSRDSDFGLGRMFEMFSDAEGYKADMKIFREIDEARAWITVE